MITEHARQHCPEIEILLVNTAVRLRSPVQASTPLRIGTGLIEGLRIVGGVTRRLLVDDVSVLHLNSPGSLGVVRDLVIVLLARASRVPVVYHLRFGRVPEIARLKNFEWRLLHLVSRLATRVICIDVATSETFATYAPRVVRVLIPNCVDLSTLPESEETSPTVVFVGWHVVAKGVEELVQAWSNVARAGWKLQMIGPAPPGVVERLTALAGESAVEFCGPRQHHEVVRRIAEAEILVLPSHTEGFPNVVVEAMAIGKPVVVTPVGAIPEMVGENAGIIVEVGSITALGAALSRLMDDARLRDEMGRAAAARARELYSLDAVFPMYQQVWQAPEDVYDG